ncbi:MAG: type II secretion system F family protein [Anaerolineales bacterium]
MDLLTITIISGFVFILLGITFIAYAASFIEAHQVSLRIQKFVIESAEQTRQPGFQSREVNFTQSLYQRVFQPIIESILSFIGRYTPASTMQSTSRQLMLAGETGIKAAQYFAIRIFFIVIGVVLGLMMYRTTPTPQTLLSSAMVVIMMFIIPILWLRMKVAKRQDLIRKSMADALDMLSVSTAAGLSFDQALLKVSQFFKTPAGVEFARVVSEMEVGVSRQRALRNFAERVQISEVSSFVAVIIQSEALGMSIADVLHAQAEQMRIQRQYRAKEEAQRLPVKMMVPLALLILPALLAVLLGPTIPAIMEIF